MDEPISSRPSRRPFLRFSLSALMLAFMCVAGLLSGYFSGYQWGVDEWQAELHRTRITSRVYNVADLVIPIPNDPNSTAPTPPNFDPLIDLITSTIDHDVWMKNGTGESEIQSFPSNLSLVVSCSGNTHDGIAELLQQLRRYKFKIPEEDIDRVREAAARKQNRASPIVVFSRVTPDNHRQLENLFESAIEQLDASFGKPTAVHAAGEQDFPVWAAAQKIAIWERGGGKLYFALQDCRPQGEALVAGWWEDSFGTMKPLHIAPAALAKAE